MNIPKEELEAFIKEIHDLTISDTNAYAKIHMIHSRCDQILGHEENKNGNGKRVSRNSKEELTRDDCWGIT